VSLTPNWRTSPEITVAFPKEKKLRHEPITCLTAYDYSSATPGGLKAAIDIVLVGDSLAQNHARLWRTLSRSRLTRCCTTAKLSGAESSIALLIADMPYGSYHTTPDEAVRNAARFVKEAGAEAVKIEGGEKRAEPDPPHY